MPKFKRRVRPYKIKMDTLRQIRGGPAHVFVISRYRTWGWGPHRSDFKGFRIVIRDKP